jgi:hypothetical protein
MKALTKVIMELPREKRLKALVAITSRTLLVDTCFGNGEGQACVVITIACAVTNQPIAGFYLGSRMGHQLGKMLDQPSGIIWDAISEWDYSTQEQRDEFLALMRLELKCQRLPWYARKKFRSQSRLQLHPTHA